MSVCWYALHSRPQKEEMLWQQLIARGMENYFPRIRTHPINPRARKILPYFPGYLFVRADLEVTGISMFQWMPFCHSLVSFGGEPAVVTDAILDTLRQRIGEVAEGGTLLLDGLKPGDKVTIHNGPFAGYDAIYDTRLSGSHRARVLLKMLSQGRNLPVELQVGSFSAKKQVSTGKS